jgi:translation initiation factor 2 alpha subunit (eIF-2alpha)
MQQFGTSTQQFDTAAHPQEDHMHSTDASDERVACILQLVRQQTQQFGTATQQFDTAAHPQGHMHSTDAVDECVARILPMIWHGSRRSRFEQQYIAKITCCACDTARQQQERRQ